MPTAADAPSPLLLVYLTYLVATASPGPSNMAIMGVAMSRGRPAALALASGVVTGSLVWAVLAASGISALLAAYAHAILAIKIAGGLYLLWLALRSARAALTAADAPPAGPGGLERPGYASLYRRGLLLHLGNPKAILAWIAIMTLGLEGGPPVATMLAILGGCAALAILVFGAYALVFSLPPMSRLYRRGRRWIEGTLAVFFGAAGLRLLAFEAVRRSDHAGFDELTAPEQPDMPAPYAPIRLADEFALVSDRDVWI